MSFRLPVGVFVLVFAILVAALVPGRAPGKAAAAQAPEQAPEQALFAPEQALFAAAAAEFRVPVEVIMAVAYVETRWVDHGSIPSFANGFGLMHLQSNEENRSLDDAARLIGLSPADLRSTTRENVRGGAAYLANLYRSAYTDDQALSRSANVARWYRPVATYLQSNAASVQRNYADAVFNTIQRGRSKSTPRGTLSLPGSPTIVPERGDLEVVPNDFTLAARVRATGRYQSMSTAGKSLAPSLHALDREAPSDGWLTSPNFSAGRAWGQRGVVIHTCQSSSSSCQSELVRAGSGKSAHFQVYSANGFREQYVHRWDKAYHCGECPWVNPPPGVPADQQNWNEIGVGIEHEGKTWEFGWYTDVMYARSAWVTAYTCYFAGWGGCDSGHVVGHSQVQPGNPDPGPYWDWGWYMYCVSLRYNSLVNGGEFSDCLG